MSSKYTKVKGYYDAKLWSVEAVRNAVVKGWITEEEFEEITSESYDAK
ncbi:MAG: XkdX family protein [Clostridiales bacterium]|nr:XkdX family protein [Clostridiales bacterium]